MKSIKNNVEITYEINKSKFICCLFKLRALDDIDLCIQNTKSKYKNATHYCYGYVFDNYKKASDDKEPSGTAGIPILDVLEKNNLNYILCVVVRYFGGIKLGAGGLLRAYSKSCSLAINESTVIELIDGFKIEIITDYSKQSLIENILNGYTYQKEYDNSIKYTAFIPNKILGELDTRKITYNIISKEKIELNF